MADATPTETAPATTDAPVAETPVVEAPVAEAPAAEVVEEAPLAGPTPTPVTTEANFGVETAAGIGGTTIVSPVSETVLHTDTTLPIGHPDRDQHQFLGQTGPAPLPLGGANGNVLRPDEVFRAAGQ